MRASSLHSDFQTFATVSPTLSDEFSPPVQIKPFATEIATNLMVQDTQKSPQILLQTLLSTDFATVHAVNGHIDPQLCPRFQQRKRICDPLNESVVIFICWILSFCTHKCLPLSQDVINSSRDVDTFSCSEK